MSLIFLRLRLPFVRPRLSLQGQEVVLDPRIGHFAAAILVAILFFWLPLFLWTR